MWIFTYGSLMYDGWESEFECAERHHATLEGYTRSFSKSSTVNWGSKVNPGPTLRVLPKENAVCHGVAFRFDIEHLDAVIKYLADREGDYFERRSVTINLNGDEAISADFFFYNGKSIIECDNLNAIAEMVLRAKGKDGTARDYLYSTKNTLDEMGIIDETVEALYEVVKRMEQK